VVAAAEEQQDQDRLFTMAVEVVRAETMVNFFSMVAMDWC
jgi:hypothetical protein